MADHRSAYLDGADGRFRLSPRWSPRPPVRIWAERPAHRAKRKNLLFAGILTSTGPTAAGFGQLNPQIF
jgi:hypothetical protein